MNILIPKSGVYDISANRLSILQECPYKLYLYLSHQDTGPVDTTYINAGNAVHLYMEDRLNGIENEPQYYKDKFNVDESMYERVDTCIENGQKYIGLKGDTELTEFKEFTTPKGREIKLQSRIDFQTSEYEHEGKLKDLVIDWKTGKSINRPNYIIQMHVYKYAKDHKSDAMLVSLLTGEELVLSNSPKSYIPKLCDKYVDAIESNDFERKESPLCERFCQYYDDFCKGDCKYNLVTPRMTWDDEKKRWTE